MLKNRVLVTGASGFIGKNLVNKLIDENYEVYSLSRTSSGFNSYAVDVRDKNKLSEIIMEVKPNVIFHLASNINKKDTIDSFVSVNYNGTKNLIEAIGNSGCLFIYTSTAELYAGNKPPFLEDMKTKFVSPYSESKFLTENYCKEQADKGKNIVNLRLFIVYGPGQIGSMFIPQLMEACRGAKDFNMTKGEQTRDFIYIGDVCDALISVMNRNIPTFQNINICSSIPTKLLDVANLVNNLWENPIRINAGVNNYRENEIMDYFGSNIKARELLEWNPKINLEEGLRRTVEWYRSL